MRDPLYAFSREFEQDTRKDRRMAEENDNLRAEVEQLRAQLAAAEQAIRFEHDRYIAADEQRAMAERSAQVEAQRAALAPTPKLRERLADIQHDIWSHWMGYLFSVCPRNSDGTVTIPADKVARWEGQAKIHYPYLSESEKESDRDQADKVLAALRGEEEKP